jgi:glycogen debranching enzyme
VACSPQAWAAASPYLLLEACLGLSIDTAAGRITLSHPVLPHALERVFISDLVVGEASIDLELCRHAGTVTVAAPKRRGHVELVTMQ